MTVTREVLDTLTVEPSVDLGQLASAIDALLESEETSMACAAAMLAVADPAGLASAIRADLDFVDVCLATRRVLSRTTNPATEPVPGLVQACITAAERSNAECSQHAAHHAHCRLCSDSSARAVQACMALVEGMQVDLSTTDLTAR